MLPFLANGVYKLSFRSACHDAGEQAAGLAIVRDGCIIGSDPGGCIINGRLAGPTASGPAAIFEGSIFVPPQSALITGYQTGPDGVSLAIHAIATTSVAGLNFLANVAGDWINVCACYVGPLPRDMSHGVPGELA